VSFDSLEQQKMIQASAYPHMTKTERQKIIHSLLPKTEKIDITKDREKLKSIFRKK
jgi:hypothetical protein